MTQFVNEPTYHPGTVKEVNGTGVTIQLAGRLGVLKLPWRMILAENKVELDQRVFINMSLVEVEN